MTNSAQYDIASIRNDFPILGRTVWDKPLVYLDNAASAQRPTAVIDAVKGLYENNYSNVHRGVHRLSQESTDLYDDARVKVRGFLNAACVHEIIFTRGTTESINLVAQSYARPRLKAGDEILITHMEHHSNIVPWQMVCEQTGASLKVVPITDRGELDMEQFRNLLSEKTVLLGVTHVSNALGSVNPVKEMIRAAHERDVPVLVDGAQAVPHIRVDVRELDADFYVFSGHKIYGPTGVGVLYGKERLLNAMPPYQGGGDMILSVTFEGTTYNELPYKFEAGTPNIAGVVGLGAAIDYVNKIGLGAIAAHEHGLLMYATSKLKEIDGLRIIGEAEQKAGLISFVLDDVHPHDIGQMLDAEGVAVRAGHHCAQPVMERFGVPATARASFAMYNTYQEIDVLTDAIKKTIDMFK
ncbi:aminotransferase class V-fold PLP-dependent enzyme [Pontiella agarivorans]|uniref:Probable cysteine desulfurase n=1 Tax=Pontiella agarivorans TaxID=3038953 RepID=A0ABU5MU47_9BACT|nr:cysteine desulfurase [Pontiella agarivorans]MDZ8117491.1 cysteine desulfurase [Pontiella agarivorans]